MDLLSRAKAQARSSSEIYPNHSHSLELRNLISMNKVCEPEMAVSRPFSKPKERKKNHGKVQNHFSKTILILNAQVLYTKTLGSNTLQKRRVAKNNFVWSGFCHTLHRQFLIIEINHFQKHFMF